jgi:hypothetical protein
MKCNNAFLYQTASTNKPDSTLAKMSIWQRLIPVDLPQDSRHREVLRAAVEDLLPKLLLMRLGQRLQRREENEGDRKKFALALLGLEATVLERDQVS